MSFQKRRRIFEKLDHLVQRIVVIGADGLQDRLESKARVVQDVDDAYILEKLAINNV